MKPLSIICCLLPFFNKVPAQNFSATDDLLWRLDSLSRSESNAKYFACLYYQTTRLAEEYIGSLPGENQSLLKKLEHSFAGFFSEPWRQMRKVPGFL